MRLRPLLKKEATSSRAPGMARSVLIDADPDHMVVSGRLGGVSPLLTRQGEQLAKGKGVPREMESEGSLRQTTDPTNRNRIRGSDLG